MLYLWIKLIHILSATVLLGTGIGTTCIMIYATRSKNVSLIANVSYYVVVADWCFTTVAGILQVITGLLLLFLAGYSFHLFWVWSSLTLFAFLCLCWFLIMHLQVRMYQVAKHAHLQQTRLPEMYYRYFKIWIGLGIIGFSSLILIYCLMIHKIHW